MKAIYFLFLLFSSHGWAANNPIVLVHGATMGGAVLEVGPLNLGEYFQGIPEYFRSQGREVEVPVLSTDSSIEERAAILKAFLQTKFKGRKVNIIAHSLGGLDARYLVSVLKCEQVASITTIATPHHGTPLANWAYRQANEGGFWYYLLRLFGYDMRGRRFLPELTTDFMEKSFNPKVLNDPKVKYFSIVAWGNPWRGTMSALLLPTYGFQRGEENSSEKDQNDGLVPAGSQSWGTELGRFELDHLAQMNHYTFRWPHSEQSLSMYHLILERLVKEGL